MINQFIYPDDRGKDYLHIDFIIFFEVYHLINYNFLLLFETYCKNYDLIIFKFYLLIVSKCLIFKCHLVFTLYFISKYCSYLIQSFQIHLSFVFRNLHCELLYSHYSWMYFAYFFHSYLLVSTIIVDHFIGLIEAFLNLFFIQFSFTFILIEIYSLLLFYFFSLFVFGPVRLFDTINCFKYLKGLYFDQKFHFIIDKIVKQYLFKSNLCYKKFF